jgi:hypothetical protein
MLMSPERDWLAQDRPSRSPDVIAWYRFLAQYSDVIPCCDCEACRRAEAMAAARRLRALGETGPEALRASAG